MSAQGKIKTRCPVCRSAYRVPDSSVGHRARCPKCDSVFRVTLPDAGKSPAAPARPRDHKSTHPGHEHPVTDDDVLRWLMEGGEKDDIPPEPRRWQAEEKSRTETARPESPAGHK